MKFVKAYVTKMEGGGGVSNFVNEKVHTHIISAANFSKNQPYIEIGKFFRSHIQMHDAALFNSPDDFHRDY